ncbi:hydrogenase iron-sulfur subunit [Natrinema salifodinae]|uniref:4Fe-4S dicluster domain-containing protein n=1 Tax=Natrinema salifodinae TaxID=1202768 RepID=A0A1I0PKF8_9EURY|nr:hydrogenase iron-sulfur subunit [Natrinema salifodinae]SEW14860.1 4Fe-4S dicluster domain-containing protein [Natrinema salifodinae]
MNVGSFVCSCADTCNIDLEAAREGVDDVDVAASSQMLCQDGLPGMEHVIEEHDLDQLIVTCPEAAAQEKLQDVASEHGLHPDAIEFVDQRESAGWVHGESEATAKTARLVNARRAGLENESIHRSLTHEAGDGVAVVGDPETAAALADTADVTLIADGRDFADADYDLDDVTIERGRVVDVDGSFGEFELTLRAQVTDDCISCMKCVHAGPADKVTSYPVDIDPDVDDESLPELCPTDAIDLDGTERTVEVDQVVYPAATDAARGGEIGFYTAPITSAKIAAIEDQLGGITKPEFLDLEMDVCAAGASSRVGCNECVEACPHDAVERSRIDEVEFDPELCQNCGACTSSCPTGATQLREPSNERIAREVEALLTPDDVNQSWIPGRGGSGLDEAIVAFVCSEQAEDALREYGRLAASGKAEVEYPPILPVRVNCTDTVGEAHVMHALAAGADGVAIVGCGGSCLHSGPDPKAELVERVNRATGDLGLDDRVAFFAPDPDAPATFVEDLSSFTAGLDGSPVPAGDHEATGEIDDPERENPAFDSHAWTLESVRAILEHVDPERDVIRGLKDFGRVEVSDACTLTPTCSNLCPTDALRRTRTGLEFNHERCVNCGLCEDGCIEDAITVEDGLHLSLLPENQASEGAAATDDDPAWSTVFEGTMLECKNCGTEFTSERSAERIKDEVGDLVSGMAPQAEGSIFDYCSDCRSMLLYNRGGN